MCGVCVCVLHERACVPGVLMHWQGAGPTCLSTKASWAGPLKRVVTVMLMAAPGQGSGIRLWGQGPVVRQRLAGWRASWHAGWRAGWRVCVCAGVLGGERADWIWAGGQAGRGGGRGGGRARPRILVPVIGRDWSRPHGQAVILMDTPGARFNAQGLGLGTSAASRVHERACVCAAGGQARPRILVLGRDCKMHGSPR